MGTLRRGGFNGTSASGFHSFPQRRVKSSRMGPRARVLECVTIDESGPISHAIYISPLLLETLSPTTLYTSSSYVWLITGNRFKCENICPQRHWSDEVSRGCQTCSRYTYLNKIILKLYKRIATEQNVNCCNALFEERVFEANYHKAMHSRWSAALMWWSPQPLPVTQYPSLRVCSISNNKCSTI